MAIVALHPAPFEAVVWIAAQSELLAAALLLAALHLWLCQRRTNDQRRTTKEEAGANPWSFVLDRWSVLATLALGLALLAKESAVIGLTLLMLLGQEPRVRRQEAGGRRQESGSRIPNPQSPIPNPQSPMLPYIPPTLLTLAYVALQLVIERRNYLLEQGGYGLGTQLLLNPLRSLALLVAPLPGTEHADAAWLAPLGALVAVGLVGFAIYDLRLTIGARRDQLPVVSRRSSLGLILALGLTLLPTAPFASPPDSRYLYLPVMAGALLVGFTIYDLQFMIGARSQIVNRRSKIVNWLLILALAWWASSELRAREGRFAAASGPGGSLWQVATSACDASRPERMVVVEPPLAAPHVEAIVELACGPDVRANIVGRDQVEGAIKGRTLVIAFPHGSAEVQRWP